MSTSTGTRPPWTTSNVVFMLAYADHCIAYGGDYKETVVEELQKRSSRTVTWSSVDNKLRRVLADYNVINAPVRELITQGTACFNVNAVPAGDLAEINAMRSTWGLTPLRAEETASRMSDSSRDELQFLSNGETENFGARDEPVLQTYAGSRSETPQVGETPDPQKGKVSDTDGAVDLPSMNTHSRTPPTVPGQQATGKKRAATPDDDSDYEDAPKPERAKSVGASSTCTYSKGTRGAVVPKSSAPAVLTTTGVSKLQKRTITSDRRNITDLDSMIEGSDSDASFDLVTGNTTSSAPYDTAFASQNPGKRKATLVPVEQSVLADNPSKRPKTGQMTFEMMENKINTCLTIVNQLVMAQNSVPTETAEHLYHLIRTAKDPNNSIVEDLIKDLDSQRALTERHKDMVKTLVKFFDLTNGTHFPKVPPQHEVDKIWARFYEYIMFTVGPNNVTPTPCPQSAGYVTASAENIAQGRISSKQLNEYIEYLAEHVQSPHAQQLLLSAIFCHWIFASPEPMLHAVHLGGMMHSYNSILAATSSRVEGLEKLKHHDKVVTKSMFEDPNFQKIEVTRRIKEFIPRLERMQDKICSESDIPSSMTPERFTEQVIELKQQLLLSPQEYRIWYARPGLVFDPTWMRAYDSINDEIPDEKAAGKPISLCMFPALVCSDSQAMDDDTQMEDVLCKNKRFFPTFKESTTGTNERSKVSRAAVLILSE